MTDAVREPTQDEIDAAVAKDKAEADKHAAETRKLTAQARKAEAEAETTEMAESMVRDRAKETRKRELAADGYHHVYRFLGAVSDSSVLACIK